MAMSALYCTGFRGRGSKQKLRNANSSAPTATRSGRENGRAVVASKKCNDCALVLSIDHFHRRGVAHQGKCKSCVRQYGAKRFKRDPERFRKQKLALRRRLATWIAEVKANTPCSDCGGRFPSEAMQWDHLPGTKKLADVSYLKNRGCTSMVASEITKCELVCANCHAVRTYNRRAHLKQR
jgi:hypothetical protein